jgi:hypothetical protein
VRLALRELGFETEHLCDQLQLKKGRAKAVQTSVAIISSVTHCLPEILINAASQPESE